MENNNIVESIDFKDKGATYWKRLMATQVRLAEHYLEALDHVDHLADLKRHESDHRNLVELITDPEVRNFFGFRWLEKTWRDEDVRKLAIERVNELADEIDAMAVTHEAFLRMASLRTTEFSSLLEDQEYRFFSAALQYAIGQGLRLYSSTMRADEFVNRLAKNYELGSRLDWQTHAESPLNYVEALNRKAEQASG